MTKRELICDGGMIGSQNPSPYGVYCSVGERDAAGVRRHVERREYTDYFTNNDAEWLALINALDVAAKLPPVDVTIIYSDSKLIVNQATGQWQITTPALQLFAEMARRAAALVPGRVVYRWHARKHSVAALGH